MTSTTDFHEANRASEILSKIGKGAADTDFARTIHQAIDAATTTNKKATVRVEVTIDPDSEQGCLMLRAAVTAKLPKLPLPGSQMHVGENGQLLTQQEFMFGGGQDEKPAKPLPIEQAAASASPSGRFPVAKAPAPAPVAAAPTPKPVVGKDAAAGEKA
jgi:hypothetical protein